MHRFNTSRRRLYVGWVIAGIFSGVLLQGVANVNLRLRLDENYLRVSAPHLHFLTGRPLERLKNGSSVLYSVQLGLSSDQFATVERRSFDRFVISYDIWEEKFSAVRLGAASSPQPRTLIPPPPKIGASIKSACSPTDFKKRQTIG